MPITRLDALGWRGAVLAACCVLAACKPAAFAGQQADLMRTPPPLLPVDANAFWNDRMTGNYGEFSVGPGLFRRGASLCRSARVTAINDAARSTQDQTLLYCAGPAGGYQLDPSLSCRPAGQGLACRDPQGDAVVLPPA